MYLKLHDNEPDKSLVAEISPIEFAYQAEQWVHNTHDDKRVVRWELYDNEGLICVWERPSDSLKLPNITKRSPRFTGSWEKGPNETPLN